jgi:hypothetical protein
MKKNNDSLNLVDSLIDAIFDLFEINPASAADPDITNRREVYAHVATFVSERLGVEITEVRDAIHRLCGEEEKDILAEGKICDAALVEQVTQMLLAIRVEYLRIDWRQAERVTVISYLAGDQPTDRRVTEVIAWGSLPGDLRDEHLRRGVSQVEFQLYPRDDNTNPQAR